MTFQLQFERRFSMAHRLISGCSPKCAIPHGHNEYIRIQLEAFDEQPLDNDHNMITSFADAKQFWHKFVDEHLDHSFQVRSDDPLITYFKNNEPELLTRLVITPGDPTTELLCACLMSKLDCILCSNGNKLFCAKFTLEETPTNTVCLSGYQAYQKHLSNDPKYWWNRGDYSINDL